MIDPTKTTPEKLAEMNDSLLVDNNYLRAELKKAREELAMLKQVDAHNTAMAEIDRRTQQEIDKVKLAACYFDGVPVPDGDPRGTLRNPDGSRSIFDDVDQ